MSRNRPARLAVLGSSFQRSEAPYSPRTGSAVRRRIVAVLLVLASLALVTVYFRESSGGTLHDVQSTGASILRPFEVAAGRVARPFRDLAGWVSGLTHAKSENEKLRRQVDELRQQLIRNEIAVRENEDLRRLLAYRDGPTFPRDYVGHVVAAAVIARAPGQFEQRIGIAAGHRQGVRRHDAVVTNDGLVGLVTRVARNTAQVTLLTDETSAVSVVDLRTGAAGILRHGQASGDALVLDRVTKDQVVDPSDPIVTAGWKAGDLASLYPKGIPVGVVTSVGQIDTDLYKQIQVRPFIEPSSLRAVLVLTGSQPLPVIP